MIKSITLFIFQINTENQLQNTRNHVY